MLNFVTAPSDHVVIDIYAWSVSIKDIDKTKTELISMITVYKRNMRNLTSPELYFIATSFCSMEFLVERAVKIIHDWFNNIFI